MVHINITFSLICLKSRKIDGKRGLCEIKKDKTNQNQSYVKKTDLNWISTKWRNPTKKLDFQFDFYVRLTIFNLNLRKSCGKSPLFSDFEQIEIETIEISYLHLQLIYVWLTSYFYGYLPKLQYHTLGSILYKVW